MVISMTAPWFGREVLGWIVDMSSIGAAIGYGYTSLAAYKTLKADPQEKKPVLKVLSVLGMVFSAIFVGLLLVPGAPSFLVPQSWVCLGIWVVLGVIFFCVTRRKTSA